MSLTKSGKRILRIFKEEYGIKKGNTVFYSFINKHPKHTKSWHLKRR